MPRFRAVRVLYCTLCLDVYGHRYGQYIRTDRYLYYRDLSRYTVYVSVYITQYICVILHTATGDCDPPLGDRPFFTCQSSLPVVGSRRTLRFQWRRAFLCLLLLLLRCILHTVPRSLIIPRSPPSEACAWGASVPDSCPPCLPRPPYRHRAGRRRNEERKIQEELSRGRPNLSSSYNKTLCCPWWPLRARWCWCWCLDPPSLNLASAASRLRCVVQRVRDIRVRPARSGQITPGRGRRRETEHHQPQKSDSSTTTGNILHRREGIIPARRHHGGIGAAGDP